MNIPALEAELAQALQGGRDAQVQQLWQRILEVDPFHGRALLALGQRAFRSGDTATARHFLQRLVAADGSDQQQWINLAVVCQSLGDEEGEEAAISGALRVAPSDLLALILRANFYERQGKVHAAATAYNAVAQVAPPLDQLNPDLRPAVAAALKFREDYNARFGSFLDEFLAPHFKKLQGEQLGRFRDSVDIMFGRKRRFESQSMVYHYPGLVPTSFFERSDFPWLDAVEAKTDAIREEFLGLLQQEEGFTPYLSYPDDQPHNQFAELNNSPRWSAFHLLKDGQAVAGNVEKCQITMATLGATPMPRQAGRTPTAMFSLLKPQTHIPPHVGVTNARLVVHLPLIIPADCGFRCGNDTRAWQPGKAWVFDDTILHEAWNNSDKLRVVLIFDTWHPHLSEAERHMVTAMAEGINSFSAGNGGFDL